MRTWGLRREGVRNLKMERERGVKDREGHKAEMPAGTNTHSSQLGSEARSWRGTYPAGARNTTKSGRNTGPRRGVPGGSSPGPWGLLLLSSCQGF